MRIKPDDVICGFMLSYDVPFQKLQLEYQINFADFQNKSLGDFLPMKYTKGVGGVRVLLCISSPL